ncbi:MAG: hypothetical protein JWO87_2848 [Phycisphaerales bacterium]|nr:hypothetical protein [Phycisphaerales bacterium]
MSGVSLPVTRPTGRALLVGNPASRAQPLGMLMGLGYACGEADDPYSAIAELCRRPMVYRALILSLSSVYREELNIVRTVKRRFPHMDVWLTHTDGRQATLAEAIRLGADGLLAEDGLHRIGLPMSGGEGPVMLRPVTAAASFGMDPTPASPPAPAAPAMSDEAIDAESDMQMGEPVLTADELRALLQEQPMLPREDGDG